MQRCMNPLLAHIPRSRHCTSVSATESEPTTPHGGKFGVGRWGLTCCERLKIAFWRIQRPFCLQAQRLGGSESDNPHLTPAVCVASASPEEPWLSFACRRHPKARAPRQACPGRETTRTYSGSNSTSAARWALATWRSSASTATSTALSNSSLSKVLTPSMPVLSSRA